MTRGATPRLGAYAGLASLGFLAALVLGRPELVAVAAPFALALAVGLATAREPELDVRVELERGRAVEGDELELRLRLGTPRPVDQLELHLRLPRGLELLQGRNPVALRLVGEEERTLRIRCARWGGYTPGRVFVRARDPLGLFVYETELDQRTPLRVYPRPEALRSPPPPFETQVFAGNQVSRAKGEGIEFADIRAFSPGDRVRRINWRASARRGSLVVNEHHPERNTDVIMFLDTFEEARAAGEGTLDLAVRAAASLAAHYLQRKDRVGLVSFGGVLSWLLPATGLVQRYRIVDSLIGTEIVFNYAWKDVDVIPRGTLPPKALVLALSPLLDERAVTALLDLRARGFDLAVIEISPIPFAAAGADELDELAHRLWRLRRDALRAQYRRLGVPVVAWDETGPLQAALEGVKTFRRHVGRVRS